MFLGNKFVGCGGFIDIAQSTKKLIFCGTFNAKGLTVVIENGSLIITSEGKLQKFINNVNQITYNPRFTSNKSQIMKIITERCVFEYKNGELELTEIMHGINLNTQILSLIEFNVNVSKDLKIMKIK